MFSFRKTNYVSASATLEIDATEPPARETCARPENAPQNPQKPRELSKRVLLLDDMVDLREVLEDYLASCSFAVTGVSNGAEGLKEFIKNPFDLVLCDMMMPKLNGEMFYWAVTRMRPAAAQRFIFLTGHQSRPDILSFFQRVNAVVLIKPFKLDDLSKTMANVLTRLR